MTNYNYDDYFSGYEPDLVNKKVINNFKFTIDKAYKTVPVIIPEPDYSNQFYDSCYYIYTEYVKQNMILILLLSFLMLFFIYRYIMKDELVNYETQNESMSNLSFLNEVSQNNKPADVIIGDHVVYTPNPKSKYMFKNDDDCDIVETNEHDEHNEHDDHDEHDENYGNYDNYGNYGNVDDDYISDQSCQHNMNHFVPTFNPYYPVDQQTSFTNYLPNSIPLSINNKYKTYYDVNPQEKYRKYMKRLPPFNENNDEVEYTGTYNTYAGARDPVLPNSIGLLDDYNSTTEKAVDFMTKANRRDIDILAQAIWN